MFDYNSLKYYFLSLDDKPLATPVDIDNIIKSTFLIDNIGEVEVVPIKTIV